MRTSIGVAFSFLFGVIVISCSMPAQKRTSASVVPDQVLLQGTIEAAESLVVPAEDVKVSYDAKTKTIHISFTTPPTYPVNYANYYLRWRDNQWVVLQTFKKANIPVDRVTVVTNYVDGSGLMRVTHLATHVDKYAKQPNDDLWLRTGISYQKLKESSNWEKVTY